MSSRIGLVSAVVVLGCLSLAQAQVVDQPQNAYAIITPESGDPARLILTETLTNGGPGGLGQTQVPPSPLLRKGALNVNIGPANEDSTGIAIVNPSFDVALVNFLVTDFQGIGILTQTFAIPPRGQISRFLSEFFGGQIAPTTSSTGLLTITADVPVAILALNFSPFGFSAVQVVDLTSPVPLTGATVVAIPTAPTPIPTTITTIPNTITTIPNTITTIPNTFISIPPPFPTTSIVAVQPTLTGGTISFGTVPNSAITTSVTKTTSLTGIFAAQTFPTVLAAPSTLTFDTLIGIGAFIFPQVVSGGGWSTEITISNTSLAPQIVRINVFDPNGVVLNTVFSTVPSLGQVAFSSTAGGTISVAR